LSFVFASLDHLSISGDVGAAAESVEGTDVLQVKQLDMLVVLMTESIVVTRADLRGRPNEVVYYLCDVEGQLPLRLGWHIGKSTRG
jgi:hypothetical protein